MDLAESLNESYSVGSGQLRTVNGTIQVVQASGTRYFLMVCEIPLVSFTASGGRISGDTNDSDYVSVTF